MFPESGLRIELGAVIAEHTTVEKEDLPGWQRGSLQRFGRGKAVAEFCAERWEGDIVEIGAYRGQLSVLLAQVAQKYGRRFIAIDPWIPGTQDCKGTEYQEFTDRIESYLDWIVVLRKKSQDPEVIEFLRELEMCYAYVDGEHTYGAVLSGIKAVRSCAGIIAVDDVAWREDIHRGYQVGARLIGREEWRWRKCREAYLSPPSKDSMEGLC